RRTSTATDSNLKNAETNPLRDQENGCRIIVKLLDNRDGRKGKLRAKARSHRGVQRVEQSRRSRVEERGGAHLIHRVTESHLRVGVREAERSTCTRMSESVRIGSHL